MSENRSPIFDTEWLIAQLETASAADLARIAAASLTFAAIVDATFERRYPLEFAVWTARTVAETLEVLEEDDREDGLPFRRH